jgi:hypothetical protein
MTERILAFVGAALLVAAGLIAHVSIGLAVLGVFLLAAGLFFNFGGSE